MTLVGQPRRYPITGGKRRVIVNIPDDSPEEQVASEPTPPPTPPEAVRKDLPKVTFVDDSLDLESFSIDGYSRFDWMTAPVPSMDLTPPSDVFDAFLEPVYADPFDLGVW
jgi:hypothetical protein